VPDKENKGYIGSERAEWCRRNGKRRRGKEKEIQSGTEIGRKETEERNGPT
jgi:hypothetical protein